LFSLFVVSVIFAGMGASLDGAQAPTKKPATPSQNPKSAAKAPETTEEEQIPPALPGALFPAVVARVNGKAVLGRDLEQRIQVQLAPMGNPKWTNLKEDYRQELIDAAILELIGSELIYQKAKASMIKATEAEVQAEFARFAKSFASDAEVNLALANRGLDRPGILKELERSITIAKFIEETITKKITVTPAEISQYYQQNTESFRHPELIRTSHILIPVPQGATQEQDTLARNRAEGLLARVKKGEDFSKLAKENSTDSTASQGGDVGITPKGQLASEYEDAAFALPVGGISGVVRTQFGYHIIKVTDKKKAGMAALPEVQEQLALFLKNQKSDAELNKLVNQWRLQAKIVAFIPVGAAKQPGTTVSSPRP
jgi:peptidyl-prolyl cis-trans isomerase C